VEQLTEAWRMALDAFQDRDRRIVLTYRSEKKLMRSDYPSRWESERIESDTLEKLSDEIGAWDTLNDLQLLASQEAPYRRALIKIGQGIPRLSTLKHWRTMTGW
jgi:hypothetical protein